MASHLSSIGMPVADQDEYLALANHAAENCVRLDADAGVYYLRWSCPGGAELWLQVNAENELVGMNPHFRGESRVRVGLTARVPRPQGSALDGAFHGWADPSGTAIDSGCYPFVFDSPDFLLSDHIQPPVVVEARIVAFAHEIAFHPSEADYHNAQTSELHFGDESFIPSGLFEDGENGPGATAIFTGHVLKTDERTNTLTGGRFRWALVRTLGGVFDVVIDPTLLDHAPEVGGILTGSFWLSGRLSRD